MRPIKLIVVLLFLLGPLSSSFCQNSRAILDMKIKAEEAFEKYDFYTAYITYDSLHQIFPEKINYTYRTGVSLLKLEYETSLDYFLKCMAQKEKLPIDLIFYLAEAYHLNHQFQDAIDHFEMYKALLETKKRLRDKDYQWIREINRQIKICRNGIQALKNPLDIEIINMGDSINSIYPDYAPVISVDGEMLLFTTDRPVTPEGVTEENPTNLDEDIFISTKNYEGKWLKGTGIGKHINTYGEDATVSLSVDGQRIIFYRNEQSGLLNNTSGDLYVGHLEGDIWKIDYKLPEQINSKYWEPSATISSDGNILIFASDRPGGYGGTDLYIVKRFPNGEWAEPMNMGKTVNTPFDEDSPYLHPDGETLYFCSNDHTTIGGYDIFSSKIDLETNDVSDPVNVGYPINTAHDDIHFSWSSDGRTIYFASRRNDTYGDKDIYMSQVYKDPANLIVMKGTVKDLESDQALEVQIILRDISTKEVTGIFQSNGSTGKYVLVFPEDKKQKIEIDSNQYETYTYIIDNSGQEGFSIVNHDILLKPIKGTKE